MLRLNRHFLSESVFGQQAQQIENTFESVLAIQNTSESVLLLGKTLLKIICWACSHKTHRCFGIVHVTIVITSVPYVPDCYANNSKY